MTELNNGIQNGAQEVSKLMLKAVFWDMDGTLIDSEPYWHEGELKIAADHGGYWDEDLAWQGSGTPVPDVARRMVEHGCKLSIEEIGKGMIDYVAQKEFERIPWIDGVEDVLLSLKEAGVPSMLVTTSPRHLAENLIAQALDGTFAGYTKLDYFIIAPQGKWSCSDYKVVKGDRLNVISDHYPIAGTAVLKN